MNFEHARKTVNDRVLVWARKQFAEELRSGFARSKCFDSQSSREALSVLQRQSVENLAILAEVLPLGVFWDGPAMVEMRTKLPTHLRPAVEKLRGDYEQEYRMRFYQHVERVYRRHDKDVKKHFNFAVQKGNEIVKEIASQWQCELHSAARGEWGLVFLDNSVRMTLALKLARNMVLNYHVSVSNVSSSRSFRFHDNYLGLLGFGVGEWEMECADQFALKLHNASEFGLWHIREYRQLLCS
jgi:hypothetical protein